MRQGVFCGLLSGGLSTGRNFADFQKIRAEGLLAKFAIARLYGHFGSRGLLKMLCYVGTLSAFYIGDDGICARVFLLPFFCRTFPWSQLCRISENACTLGAAVCCKMLCYVST